jgi:hypothetical protein
MTGKTKPLWHISEILAVLVEAPIVLSEIPEVANRGRQDESIDSTAKNRKSPEFAEFGIHDLCSYMTGVEGLHTHEVHHARRALTEFIRKDPNLPEELRKIEPPELPEHFRTRENTTWFYQQWIREQEQKFGTWFQVNPIDNYQRDFEGEAARLSGGTPMTGISATGIIHEVDFFGTTDVRAEAFNIKSNDYLQLSYAVLALGGIDVMEMMIRPEDISQQEENLVIGLNTTDYESAKRQVHTMLQYFSEAGLTDYIDSEPIYITKSPNDAGDQYAISIDAEGLNRDEKMERLVTYVKDVTATSKLSKAEEEVPEEYTIRSLNMFFTERYGRSIANIVYPSVLDASHAKDRLPEVLKETSSIHPDPRDCDFFDVPILCFDIFRDQKFQQSSPVEIYAEVFGTVAADIVNRFGDEGHDGRNISPMEGLREMVCAGELQPDDKSDIYVGVIKVDGDTVCVSISCDAYPESPWAEAYFVSLKERFSLDKTNNVVVDEPAKDDFSSEGRGYLRMKDMTVRLAIEEPNQGIRKGAEEMAKSNLMRALEDVGVVRKAEGLHAPDNEL